jgi:hypothetical protein
MADLTQDDGFFHWLAGFIDGEGCFRIQKEKRGGYYACQFSLKLRDDDRAILNECVCRTGAGIVHRMAAYRTSKPGVRWAIQSRADCWKLATILDRYPLRAKKAHEYAIWRQALETWTTMQRGNRWHGPRDWSPMIAFKAQLEAWRVYR